MRLDSGTAPLRCGAVAARRGARAFIAAAKVLTPSDPSLQAPTGPVEALLGVNAGAARQVRALGPRLDARTHADSVAGCACAGRHRAAGAVQLGVHSGAEGPAAVSALKRGARGAAGEAAGPGTVVRVMPFARSAPHHPRGHRRSCGRGCRRGATPRSAGASRCPSSWTSTGVWTCRPRPTPRPSWPCPPRSSRCRCVQRRRQRAAPMQLTDVSPSCRSRTSLLASARPRKRGP